MEGRDYVLPEDIKEIAYDVMNHRILLNYEAEADGVTTKDIIDKNIETGAYWLNINRETLTKAFRLGRFFILTQN